MKETKQCETEANTNPKPDTDFEDDAMVFYTGKAPPRALSLLHLYSQLPPATADKAAEAAFACTSLDLQGDTEEASPIT